MKLNLVPKKLLLSSHFSVHSYLLKYFRACTSITNATLEIYLEVRPHAPGRMKMFIRFEFLYPYLYFNVNNYVYVCIV